MVKLVAALVLASAAVAVAQQPTPFRVATELVSIYATVTDARGRLVPDLTQNDFVVRDNGKPQRLTFFSNAIQPITIVIMLDRSGSMADHFDIVRRACEAFVRRLLPADKVRLGDFSQEIRIKPLDFTSDQDELMDLLHDGLQDSGPSPVWTAVDRSITALLNQSGRRVVLLFSDGQDSPKIGQIRTDVKDVIRRAKIDDVMVYSIGFSTPPPGLSFLTRNGRRGGIQWTVTQWSSGKPQRPDKHLKQLAEETGGGYFEFDPFQDLSATFTRVADELHHQYWLGFTPAKLDGKTHKLEVESTRRELRVRARKSYVASAAR